MKLIIDIPEKIVTAIRNGEDYRFNIHTAIAQGMPYEERPQGEWIKDSVGTIICSNCGCSLGHIVVKLMYPFSFYYCPECGTKMEGDTEND